MNMVTERRIKYELALLLLLSLLASIGIAGTKGQTANDGAVNPSAISSQAASYPNTEMGARALLNEFLKSGADHAALTKPLRPTTADYLAVFVEGFAKIAETAYARAWDNSEMVVAPKPGQTELKLSSATSEDLKKWNDKAEPFPGGYKNVAAKFKDGLTIYRFKFVKLGEEAGLAYDGLIYVNGQWRIFPKPWQIGR
jgi:hypothetical protein